MRKRGVTWDNMPYPAFTIKDVDDWVVDYFRKLAAKKGRIDEGLLEDSIE